MAEIERLTRERDEARATIAERKATWEAEFDLTAAWQARAEKAEAEVERLRRLVCGGVHNAGAYGRSKRPRWAFVRRVFAVGSTTAWALCVEHGLDPDEEVGGLDA